MGKYEKLLLKILSGSSDRNPELPGCIAHGSTQEDALKNINEAIQLWIDTAHEHDDFIPEPKCHRLMYA